ncbi:RNase A-like domain-containing protein [Erwinia psidii]|uniref:RNase A-like domain-containing protein n=1 Tax=Erwinia psidii TaxID=69224 RepID=UPI00226B770A|nr:RNase A-like domain-containing protein [Erwinia psidii]
MFSKVGCVVVGAHSLDTIKTSLNQVITGRESQTATAQLAQLAAEQLGADTATAYKVGVTVDLVVPFAFASAAGAARVSAVYSGRIRLAQHEGGALGHTIARHIGLTSEQMIARLTGPKAPARASTFYSLRHAELLISDTLSVKRYQIMGALKYMKPGSRMRLDNRFYFPTGQYIEKGTTTVKKTYGLRVIVEAKNHGNKTYYIVTAYPVP